MAFHVIKLLKMTLRDNLKIPLKCLSGEIQNKNPLIHLLAKIETVLSRLATQTTLCNKYKEADNRS